MTGPVHQVLRFETTAQASADAHALARPGLGRLDVIVDGVALVVALLLFATGNVLLGVAVIVVAGLSVLGSRFHPLQRALIAFRFRSLLGPTTEVTIDDKGLRFENPLGAAFVPWSSITAIRSNSRTVAFFRDRVLLGYVPSSAFESAEAQASMAAVAEARITPAR
jgi:hypothetical protein